MPATAFSVRRVMTEVSIERSEAVISEITRGRFRVLKYPGFMLGPALKALEKKKLTDKVRIDLHLSQGTVGFFELWIPV